MYEYYCCLIVDKLKRCLVFNRSSGDSELIIGGSIVSYNNNNSFQLTKERVMDKLNLPDLKSFDIKGCGSIYHGDSIYETYVFNIIGKTDIKCDNESEISDFDFIHVDELRRLSSRGKIKLSIHSMNILRSSYVYEVINEKG